VSGGAWAEGKRAEAVLDLDALMVTSVRWEGYFPPKIFVRCNLMVLATAIYCTWVDEMTNVVALPKPKFTSRGALCSTRPWTAGSLIPSRVARGACCGLKLLPDMAHDLQ
jgi:hypothetical protein